MIEVVVRLPRTTIEQSFSASLKTGSRVALAHALLDGQRSRTSQLSGLRFSDPLWDMILEIYVAATQGRQFKVLELCAVSGSSTATALRYLKMLENNGYTTRHVDDSDTRSYIIVMQPSLRAAVDEWLERFEANRCCSISASEDN